MDENGGDATSDPTPAAADIATLVTAPSAAAAQAVQAAVAAAAPPPPPPRSSSSLLLHSATPPPPPMSMNRCTDCSGGRNPIKKRSRSAPWTVPEMLTLIDAKRKEREWCQMYKRGVKLPAAERWRIVAAHMEAKDMGRTGSQCQDKWENMMKDYKAVRDWQCMIGGAAKNYFKDMTNKERKDANLPPQMDEIVFYSLHAIQSEKEEKKEIDRSAAAATAAATAAAVARCSDDAAAAAQGEGRQRRGGRELDRLRYQRPEESAEIGDGSSSPATATATTAAAAASVGLRRQSGGVRQFCTCK